MNPSQWLVCQLLIIDWQDQRHIVSFRHYLLILSHALEQETDVYHRNGESGVHSDIPLSHCNNLVLSQSVIRVFRQALEALAWDNSLIIRICMFDGHSRSLAFKRICRKILLGITTVIRVCHADLNTTAPVCHLSSEAHGKAEASTF